MASWSSLLHSVGSCISYRDVILLILAPGLAVLASLERPLLASYAQIFVVATGGFIVQYFPGLCHVDSGAHKAWLDRPSRGGGLVPSGE